MDLMPFALENGRHEFISEFIEREDVVEKYLTVDELRRLYQKVLANAADLNESTCVYRSFENRFDNIVLLQMPKNCIFRYLLKRRRSENRREYKRNMAQAEATSVRNPRLKEQPSFETTDNEQQEKFASLKTRIKRAPFTLEEVRIALSREFSLNSEYTVCIEYQKRVFTEGFRSSQSLLMCAGGRLPHRSDRRFGRPAVRRRPALQQAAGNDRRLRADRRGRRARASGEEAGGRPAASYAFVCRVCVLPENRNLYN